MRVFILSLYTLIMVWEVSVLLPSLMRLANLMDGKQAVIRQVVAEWNW